jgi:hypothetical protein
LRFLRQSDEEHEPALELHLVMDKDGRHKAEQVKHHQCFKIHFIPTRSSWMIRVEPWFGEFTGKAVRRRSFASVPDLIEAIEGFIREWNGHPQPFVWRARDGGWRRSSPVARFAAATEPDLLSV